MPLAQRELEEINLLDLDVFVRGVPHEWFRRLRAEAPVWWHPDPGSPRGGFWVVTKYRDVLTVSRDPATFSSARGGALLQDWDPETAEAQRQMMLNMDPPQHAQYRKLVNKGFTPRMINRLEPHIRELVTRIIDGVAPRGSCDFVTDVAAELPLQVICEFLGVPPQDRHKVIDWSNRMVGSQDPEYVQTLDEARQAQFELWAYANELARERRRAPAEDLVSVLVHAEVEGHRLTELEFDLFFLLLSVAGNETTRNLVSGGMLALLEHPQERARLASDPSLLPAAVEEMLRWVSPVMHFRRTATRDVELGGQTIREGDKVSIWYVSANRDEDVFPDPDRFDAGRQPNEHLAFGIGEHFCLGANLARLEIRVMFEELLSRLPDLELAGPVQRLRSNFINGIKHMPVRFTPRR